MRNVLLIVVIMLIFFSLQGMKRSLTAIFEDNQIEVSSDSLPPLSTVSPRTLVLEETPRTVVSFLYAFMHLYRVDVARQMIIFNDFVDENRRYSLPFMLVAGWIMHLVNDREVVLNKAVSPATEDQIELAKTRAQFIVFLSNQDLLPTGVARKSCSELLAHNRTLRTDAFMKTNFIEAYNCCNLPVQYYQIAETSLEMRPQIRKEACCLIQ